VRRIAAGARLDALAAVIGEHLADRVRQQGGALGRAAAAEQVERKDDDGGGDRGCLLEAIWSLDLPAGFDADREVWSLRLTAAAR